MLCLRTRINLELDSRAEFDCESEFSGSNTICTSSIDSLSSAGSSGKPSIFRRSDTFMRAVASPTQSPSYKYKNFRFFLSYFIKSNK